MTKISHTTLPWFPRGSRIVDGRYVAGFKHNEPRYLIAEMRNAPNEPVEANAEFICRAVNSHYELLAALKRAVVYFVDGTTGDATPGYEEIVSTIRAAIAKATEKI